MNLRKIHFVLTEYNLVKTGGIDNEYIKEIREDDLSGSQQF